jgi:hypothetical protein
MRWNIETKEEYIARLSNWHRWLAWRPVRIVNSETKRTQRVWLETVWRRGSLGEPDRDGVQWWSWTYLSDPADFELLKMIGNEKEF